MNITNLFKIAMKAIGANKMRSFLTMLGIIIGVSSVIIMLALGHGAKETIKQDIQETDPGTIMIIPGPDYETLEGDWLPEYSQTLKPADYQSILEQNKYLKSLSPMVFSDGQLVCGNNNHSTTVYGVNDQYPAISGQVVEKGSIFTEEEIHSSAKVCVIGKSIVDKLYDKDADPIGTVIRINNIPVAVVGVLKSKGKDITGRDQDDLVLMPYTTVMKRMNPWQNYYNMIYATAENEKMIDLAMKDVTEILRANHKIKEGDMQDFNVRSLEQAVSMVDSVMGALTLLLSCIAGISLLVGGIGIMNIMYVSVTERTREIGLRMSVGARTRDIMNQFLIEAILISVTGGLIGVLIGASIAYFARFILMNFTEHHFLIAVEPWTVLLAFAICTITGVFFGWYPAKKAANLDPIDALRYE
ncbi:MAG: ABC transporter permease [Muribaculaceae bacterium]|nr:ABC transporter permease [Muribaculaceae bacterium]